MEWRQVNALSLSPLPLRELIRNYTIQRGTTRRSSFARVTSSFQSLDAHCCTSYSTLQLPCSSSSSSSIQCGKRALASYSPTPFLPIASLLFSEKRPGDLPCRQILVDLLTSIFDICPIDADTLPKSAWASPEVSLEASLPSPPTSSFASPPFTSSAVAGSEVRRYQRKIKSSDSDSDSIEREEVLTPGRIQATHRFVVSLMEGPPDEKEEAKVDFIKQSHRPRVFKAWVTEIADCVRDYFW